ncbi:helix-turn-helix domain-containing protein [Dysosmobacter sp.]|uniref:helix-turn-helix domain-containing protein n=1 Tax=Dysosmobacter sp. TaxID=2591382 RepID=UPI003AF1D23A
MLFRFWVFPDCTFLDISNMRKIDLCVAAGISHASMAKLGKNENVTTDVLVKICTALQCDIGDIMEITDSSNN